MRLIPPALGPAGCRTWSAPHLQLLCPPSPAAVPSSWPCSQHGWHEQKGGNEAKLSKYFQLGVALGSPRPPPPIFTLPVAPLAMAGSSGQHSKGIPVTLCQGMKPSQEQGGAGTAGLVCDPQSVTVASAGSGTPWSLRQLLFGAGGGGLAGAGHALLAQRLQAGAAPVPEEGELWDRSPGLCSGGDVCAPG